MFISNDFRSPLTIFEQLEQLLNCALGFAPFATPSIPAAVKLPVRLNPETTKPRSSSRTCRQFLPTRRRLISSLPSNLNVAGFGLLKPPLDAVGRKQSIRWQIRVIRRICRGNCCRIFVQINRRPIVRPKIQFEHRIFDILFIVKTFFQTKTFLKNINSLRFIVGNRHAVWRKGDPL